MGLQKTKLVGKISEPSIVLGDEGVMSMNVDNGSFFGRVKVFASLANLKMALGNEGFSDIVIKATNEFEVDGRIAWVEVEGVPFKLWTNNTFTRIAEKWGKLLDVDDQDETCFHSKRLCVYLKAGNSIREDFKITHRGKMYWIRANETQGWVPEFTDEYEKEVDKTPCLKHPTKQGFTLWNIIVENDTSEEEGKTRMMYSVRLVMLIKLNRKCNGSISAGHFKVSEFLRTGGIHVGSLLEGCDKSWDRGKWRLREKNMLIIGVYAPQRFGIILIHMVLIDLILLFCIRGLVEVNLEFFSCAKQYHMEREVSNDEIKKSVWECGTDKAPGPDGFTFGFFRHFWHLVDRDVCEAVRRVWVWDNWDKWDSMLSSFFERVFHINGSPKPDEFHFGRVVDAGMFHGIDVGGLVNLSHMFYADDAVFIGDMNKIQSWKDIIDRIRRRLSRWKMKMLSIGGRLMLIKSVLGSMPIFHMSMFKVPAGVIQILESLRSKFFNGHESSGKKASWVQWKKALAPKDNGGLGIFSLYALNRGLIFKWVWRFLAHEPTLWSRVIKAIHGANGKIDEISGKGANSCWINIIKEVRRLEEKGINLLLFMKKKLGNGLSTLFWDDVWCDGGKLKNRFPRAYALENSKQITVGQKLAHPSLYHSFRRHPRGGLELTQVEELAKVINPVVLTQSPDSWSWTLNNSGGYTVASSRNMIDSRLLPKGDLKTRWIRYVPNKVNTFAWKVMTNSLPTRFNISRRGIDIESLSCVNCDVGIETNDHLFFACNTAKKISKLINRWWDVPFMDINSYGEWRSWIDNVKMPKKNKIMFQGIYFVMWWLLWNFRNKKMFEAKPKSKETFFDEIICSSYYLCRYRCNTLFSWDDWYKNPSLISL
ncbi:RNA-directed DNA polymerase, eukaryota, reverse transcriptase zinc-binding domain protein [Tanacetum coccineum]